MLRGSSTHVIELLTMYELIEALPLYIVLAAIVILQVIYPEWGPLASRKWAATTRKLISRLKAEVDNRQFISNEALQSILPSHQVTRLLYCAPRRERKRFLDHILSHGPKLLAIHLLDENFQRIRDFLRNPLDVGDQALFVNHRTNGSLSQWQRPLAYNGERFDWMFRLHWHIPPALQSNLIVEYPQDFKLPFDNEKFIGSGSFGDVHSAQVGSGYIKAYNNAIIVLYLSEPSNL